MLVAVARESTGRWVRRCGSGLVDRGVLECCLVENNDAELLRVPFQTTGGFTGNANVFQLFMSTHPLLLNTSCLLAYTQSPNTAPKQCKLPTRSLSLLHLHPPLHPSFTSPPGRYSSSRFSRRVLHCPIWFVPHWQVDTINLCFTLRLYSQALFRVHS
jgi:hypothetical protein